MTIYAITSIVASALCFVVGIIALFTRKSKSHIALAVITFSISLWTLFPLLTTIIEDLSFRLLITRILYIPAAIVPFSFFYLALSVIDTKSNRLENSLLLICQILTIIFMVLAFHPLYIGGIGQNNGARYVIPGPLFPLFQIYFVFVCGWTFWLLVQTYRKTEGLKKNQIKYFFAGFILAYIGGALHFLSSYIKSEPIPHDFLIISCTLILGYAILRYRLMDFNLLIRWGTAYGLTLFLLGLILLATVYTIENTFSLFIKTAKGIPTVIIGCSLVFVFDPLRKRVSGFVDKFIFRSPDYNMNLTGIENTIEKSSDLNYLCSELIAQLKNIWEVDHAGFVLWDYKDAEFKMYPIEQFENQIISTMDEKIKPTDFLIKTLEAERRLFKYGIVVDDELSYLINRSTTGERTTFSKIRRSMRWLGAVVCVPIMSHDQLIGFLVLGKKKNGGLYNDEDKMFLSHLIELITKPINHFLNHETPISI